MKPADLGLPSKYTVWRSGQDDAIVDSAIALADKRFVVSAQPTGAGKSVYYVALARLMGARRTLILTITKPLSLQLERDFQSMGMVQIKGQANYPCLAVRVGGELYGLGPVDTRCDEGPCHAGVPCSLKEKGCAYYDEVGKAARAEIVVTNYDYWMHANKFGDDPIGKFDLLILDEAHEAPEKLAEFVSIYLGEEEVDELLGAVLPKADAPMEYWIDWAKKWGAYAKLELEEHKIARSSVRTVRRLRNLVSKLEDVAHAAKWTRGNPSAPEVWIPGSATDWIAEQSDHGVTFSPVWAHGYAEQFLFSNIPRIVLTSATIIPQTLAYLGLRPEEFVFDERPSTFPVERRPIYIMDTAPSVRFEMTRGEEMVWMNKIDYILSSRLDRKAIIHAHSYPRAKQIYQQSKYRHLMLFHDRNSIQDQVEKFRQRRAPAILVSPAVKAGWDFPYSECELQIIAKIPFVPMQSAVMKARHRADKGYSKYLAIMSLIQEVGRGMRAPDDFCETFIIDGAIGWLMAGPNKRMFPRYFKRAVTRISTIPGPPKLRARSSR